MTKRYHIWTEGCQMNVADSQKLAAGLDRFGWLSTEAPEDADLVVVNTCVVRESAEHRAISKMGSLAAMKRKGEGDFKIVVMGCMVGPKDDELRRRFPYVDHFARPQAFEGIFENLGLADDTGGEFWPTSFPTPTGPTAYVPIIHGCNLTCTYCIVPFRRGRELSRPIPDIVREVQALTERRVREVTLLGQNVDSYGNDLQPHVDLADLLVELDRLPDLWRIRFLTSHPKDMSQKLIDTVAALPKACEHINLPVQAGDDLMLQRMRRRYTLRYYRDLVRRIRETIPGVSLATDIIVGFRGETAEQFQHTMDLLAELRFDKVHVAAYSPRPGTVAATWPDDVPHEEKMARLHTVETFQEALGRELNGALVGQTLEILVEGREKGRWMGRTRTNKIVYFAGEAAEPHRGALRQVLITEGGPWSLVGRLAEPIPTVGPGTQLELAVA